MGSIKYYHLAKDETPPEEFCAVRDIGGEPSEYMFYVPESEVAKLRELIRAMWFLLCVTGNDDLVAEVGKNGETIRSVEATAIAEKMRELGIEVER